MNKKILIIVLAVIIIIIGALYFLQQPQKTQKQNIQLNIASTSTNSLLIESSTTETSSLSKTYNITIENFLFTPVELNIKKGDIISWINKDSAPHQISGKIFQSNILNKGQNFNFTFNTIGISDYICGIHPYMKGSIIVE